MSRKGQLSTKSIEVVRLADTLKPNGAKRVTEELKYAALLFLKFISIGASEHGEDYTIPELARMLFSGYDDLPLASKKGHQKTVRNIMLLLADASSKTRGMFALGVAPFTEETHKLFRRGDATVDEVLKTYSFRRYTRLGVFANQNGEFCAGWAANLQRITNGRARRYEERVSGWNEGGILTSGTIRAAEQITGRVLSLPEPVPAKFLPKAV